MTSIYRSLKQLVEQFPALHRSLLTLYQRYFALQLAHSITMRNKQVLIYQMGKVGSSSILASLQQQPAIHPMHIHYIYPDNVRWRQQIRQANHVPQRAVMHRGLPIYRQLVQAKKPVKVITPVREPISRNISFFFQVFELYVGVDYTQSHHSIAELCALFLDKNEHALAIDWFDIEFQKALDVDVYQYEFPRERGFLRIQQDNLDILLLKAELDDAKKEIALADFLEKPDFKLAQANISQDKAYAETYAAFKKQLTLPESYLASMLDSRYTQHFYTSAERDFVRDKWLRRLHETALVEGGDVIK